MIDVGRVCIKTAGRDAGLKCVVVEVLDDNYVTVDGQTRRRKVNVRHLEPLDETLDIKKKADHSAVVKAFKSIDVEIAKKAPKKEKKAKPKKKKKKKSSGKKKSKKKSKKSKKKSKKSSKKKKSKDKKSDSSKKKSKDDKKDSKKSKD